MIKKLVSVFSALSATLGAAFVILAVNAAGTNLIANPSLETANGTTPASWSTYKTGTNTTAFNYLTTGHTGSHSVQVNMTKRSSGQAAWVFTPVNVAPNTKYTFTDWYKSNVASSFAVIVNRSNGTSATLSTTSTGTSANWKQSTLSFTTPSNATTVTVRHYINQVGQLTTDDYDLEGPAVVAPTVSVTAPVSGATVSGTQTVSATATGTSIKNVQFKLDGANLGAADTTAPYSVSWNTKNSTNVQHTLSAVVTTTNGLTATAPNIGVKVANATAPTVNVTAPASGATVSGSSQTVSANATDTIGMKSVQFKLDGANLGAADTTAPYSVSWNTTQASNGNHTLTAVATNTSNLSTTSTGVVANVQNAVVTPPTGTNLIPNPSLETASNSAPASWLSSNWGTNTSTFSYLATGHTGSHSVKVQTTSYTDGAANWYYPDVTVSGGKTYKYSNWYQSNVDTEVDAEVVMSDGSVQYYWLGTVFANTNWTQYTNTFTVPAGAKSMAIYQILAKTGYIVSDDYSLMEYTPLPLNRGLVSVALDDGWTNQYTNAFPVLQQYGIKGTFYIISGELTDQPDYMSGTQVKNLFAAGNEIGSHSVTHPDLTTETQAQVTTEMSQSKTTLQNLIGVPVTDFAYPFGAFNASTIAIGKQYYQSQRSVSGGLNTKDNLDLTQLKIEEVDSNISQAQVQGWINAAIAQKSWLILVYHEVAVTPSDPTDELYTTQPSDFAAEMAYLKNSGVATVTVNQAINEILPQL